MVFCSMTFVPGPELENSAPEVQRRKRWFLTQLSRKDVRGEQEGEGVEQSLEGGEGSDVSGNGKS